MPEKIIQKLWQSQICCKIIYPNSNNHRKCLYLLINRNSYLYFKIEEIFEFFNIPITQIPYIWFEDSKSKRILDWNLPIDLLFNLFQSDNDFFEIILNFSILSQSSLSTSSSSQSILSYQHYFQSINSIYDKQHLLSFDDISKFLEKNWRNLIKESCYILNNSSNLIMSMSLDNSIDFWNSVNSINFIKFEKYFNKFLPINPKNLPIKLYFVDKVNNLLLFIYQPNLHKLFPHLSLNQITLKNLIDKILSLKSNIHKTNIEYISHGINLPENSPIDELYSTVKYFDTFLYIIIKI